MCMCLLCVCMYVYLNYFPREAYSHYRYKILFFPVDSMAHDFMFNLTPCSIVNKPIWSLALTWIPSESLL